MQGNPGGTLRFLVGWNSIRRGCAGGSTKLFAAAARPVGIQPKLSGAPPRRGSAATRCGCRQASVPGTAPSPSGTASLRRGIPRILAWMPSVPQCLVSSAVAPQVPPAGRRVAQTDRAQPRLSRFPSHQRPSRLRLDPKNPRIWRRFPDSESNSGILERIDEIHRLTFRSASTTGPYSSGCDKVPSLINSSSSPSNSVALSTCCCAECVGMTWAAMPAPIVRQPRTDC